MEEWKCIYGYNNRYSVSSFGRVRSGDRVLKPQLNKKRRYHYICLEGDGRRKNHILHRLVAYAFLPQVWGKNQVNHKDADKGNNKIDNLEWVTKEENYEHARKMGVYVGKHGENSPCSRLKEKDVLEIFRLRMEKGLLHRQIAQMYGMGVSTITHILLGTRWSYLK